MTCFKHVLLYPKNAQICWIKKKKHVSTIYWGVEVHPLEGRLETSSHLVFLHTLVPMRSHVFDPFIPGTNRHSILLSLLQVNHWYRTGMRSMPIPYQSSLSLRTQNLVTINTFIKNSVHYLHTFCKKHNLELMQGFALMATEARSLG